VKASHRDSQLSVVSGESVKEGPIVAVQYPEKPPYTLTPESIEILDAKYKHLVDIDHTNSEAVEELAAAISDVRSQRTENKKEEDTIKKPLNVFRSLVIDIGKKLRGKVQVIEDRLKVEKARIDQIKADEKRAEEERLLRQRKEQQDNLAIIQAKGQNLYGLDLEKLKARKQIIDCCDLGDFDFGEMLSQAEFSLEQADMAVQAAIAQEEQRLQMLEQERVLKEQQAEIDRQQEEQRLEDEAAAEKQAQIDLAKSIVEAEIGVPVEGVGTAINDDGASDELSPMQRPGALDNVEIATQAAFSNATEIDNPPQYPPEYEQESHGYESQYHNSPAPEQSAEAQPTPAENQKMLEGKYVEGLISQLKHVVHISPKASFYTDPEFCDAVGKVLKTVDNAVGFLERVSESKAQ